MPSLPHEAPLAVLREAPQLVAELLRDLLGVDVPAYAIAETADADLTQVVPTELRADLVVVLRGPEPARPPVLGVVVEVQRRRDERKRWSWPLYVASLHTRLGCQVCLLVIATDPGTAAWAASPITTLQPGSPFVPLVLAPDQVPRVDSQSARRQPWLAVLSALAHGNREGGVAIALAALDAVASLPEAHATLCFDLIVASLDDAGRRALEEMMETRKYEYQSEFARRYFGAGQVQGSLLMARTILLALLERRFPVDPALRARIDACEDADRLASLVVAVDAAADEAAVRSLLRALETD
ncbi:MAG: hypothetical protein K8M05_09230 [Deltaproteobacteria bacterium]|nr:hypothetical protein [Kofleriaceae bacterium]